MSKLNDMSEDEINSFFENKANRSDGPDYYNELSSDDDFDNLELYQVKCRVGF